MPGAGFFIAPGKVLTCVHVIGDCEETINIAPGFRVVWSRDGEHEAEFQVAGVPRVLANKGRAIANLACDYPDIAVLDVAGCPRTRVSGWIPGGPGKAARSG
jgi:hypothetical protein